ncbi:MAG: sterol desaturase family protein, partial [Polyangiaceae bacterium]|nr:sterol desaturase family protein [Polyangiaceae bacterium]
AARGGAAGVCAWFFQGQVSAWEILGVDALSMVWTLLGSNLRHSQVWLSFGPVLERVWLSPAQHQIHHSVDPQHHDKNFGEALAIWDALAGTLVLSGERQQLTFGLAPEERNHGDTALSLVVAPWLASVRRLLSGVSRGKVLVESLGVKR